MLIANLPIRPIPKSPGGLGGAMPTSPTPYELRRALFDYVSYSTDAFEWMDIYVESQHPKIYQDLMKEINTVIRQLGDKDPKIFFHRPNVYELKFVEKDQDAAVNRYREDQQLNADEIEHLKLGQVQSALISFRDSTQQLWERSQGNEEEFLVGLKSNQARLTESLNRILDL